MGNEQSALDDGTRVVVETDVKKLKQYIEVNGELEWEEDVYEDTVGKEGVVVRTDDDGTVAVRLCNEEDEVYFPREALQEVMTTIQVQRPEEGQPPTPGAESLVRTKSPCMPPLTSLSFRSQLSTSSFRELATSLANEGRMTPHLFAVLFTVAFNGFILGYIFRIFDTSTDLINFGGKGLSGSQIDAIMYICYATAVVGAWSATALVRLGRKGTVVTASAFFVIGEVMCAGSRNIETMMFGKFFTGLGLGWSTTVVPMYLSEISPEGRKGTFVTVFIAMLLLGRIAASLLSLNFTDVAPDDNDSWRWMLGIIVLPACVQFLFLLRIPETPLILVKKGHVEAAKQIARMLYNGSEASVAEMQQIVSDSKAAEGSYKKSLARHRNSVIFGVVLQFLHLFLGPPMLDPTCGDPAPTMSHLLQSQVTGDNSTTAVGDNLTHVTVDVLILVVTVIFVFTIHVFNRRALLLVSLAGTSVCLALVGVTVSNDLQLLSVALLLVHFVAYGTGMALVPWILNTEMHTVRLREQGMGLVSAAYWVGIICVQITRCWGVGTGIRYWLLTVTSSVVAVGVYMKLPETRNLGVVHSSGLKGKRGGSAYLEAPRVLGGDDDDADTELMSADQLSHANTESEAVFTGLSIAPHQQKTQRAKGGFRKKKSSERKHPLHPADPEHSLFDGLQVVDDTYTRA